MPNMEITLNQGKADAHIRDFVINTGVDSPSPFELFIASLGTCAALTIDTFCKTKGLSADGIKIQINVERHPETRLAAQVNYEYIIPENFPEDEIPKLVRAAGVCFVKKHFANPPEFTSSVTRL